VSALRRLSLLASVLLAGASGLGLEVLLLSSAGLVLGYGRSTAIGLALFIAGWAIGAFLAGRARKEPARALLIVGALLAVLSYASLRFVLWLGSEGSGSSAAELAAALTIALVAAGQGAFLPLLARATERIDPRRRDVSLLLGASFAGSVLGAFAIGDRAVAAVGRAEAAAIAGGAALAAAVLAAIALRSAQARENRTHPRLESPGPHATVSLRRAAWIVGSTTAWLAGLEWIGLRLGVLWLSGMQSALTAVLCASLIALSLGAALIPRALPISARSVTVVLIVCVVGGIWPVHAARAMHLLGRWTQTARPSAVADPRAWQAALDRTPELARALVLVGPALLAFGAIVPMLHRALARASGASGERLGRLYLHEAWGALLGVPVVHFVLVPELGLAGATAALIALGAFALAMMLPTTPRLSIAAIICAAGIAAWTGAQSDPALDSPPLSNPAFTLRSFHHDRNFAVAVVDDGLAGERTLLTDGFRAAGTGAEYRYMSVLGHLPVLLHERPRRAAVLALGTGTTLGAVALHPEVEHIDVLEISAAVVDAASWFEAKNHGVLCSAAPDLPRVEAGSDRVRVWLGDGRRTLAQHPGQYDVITMEPLLPDSPFAVYLYTRQFYERARRALAPGGLLCQWVPPHALEPVSFRAVLSAFESSFPWSSAWLFGTQVILLGGERAPALDERRFADLARDLRTELSDLGIESPRGLVARFVRESSGGRSGSVQKDSDARDSDDSASLPEIEPSAFPRRALTDDDPWITYRARRSGAVLLTDLPENLRWLRRHGSEPPRAWIDSEGPGFESLAQGVHAVHAAREAHAREEADLRGATWRTERDDPDLSDSLALARKLCGGDPELRELEHEITFLAALRRGISELSADRSRAGAESALPDLLRAAELERERSDVHLYVAAALSRLDSPAASKALETALARCPRAAETVEGLRARDLGLSGDLWGRAEQSAGAAPRLAP
jgi:spermidine synthase